MDIDVDKLTGVIIQAADEELLPRFSRTQRHEKQDGSVVTEADTAMQTRLRSEFARHWPHYPMLGEEMEEATQTALLQDTGPRLWCVDPLDGTSNFAAGIPFFAVSVALLEQGQPQLGVVYDPVRRDCFQAQRGEGAWYNNKRLATIKASVTLAQAIAMVDFKRLDAQLAWRLAEMPPYASQRSIGSVALDWCWIAAGWGHVYLHGRQRIWDYAAGSLILSEAGGHAVTLGGETVFRLDITPRSAVAALDETLFRDWCNWLGIS